MALSEALTLHEKSSMWGLPAALTFEMTFRYRLVAGSSGCMPEPAFR